MSYVKQPRLIKKDFDSVTLLELEDFMFNKGIIYLEEKITKEYALSIIKQLEVLASCDDIQEIKLVISSPGGAIDAGLMIINSMEKINKIKHIISIAQGTVASMASLIYCTSQERLIYKDAKIMVHQPSIADYSGTCDDVDYLSKTMVDLKKRTANILSSVMKVSNDEIYENYLSKDTWFNSDECLNNGLATGLINGSLLGGN